MKAHTNKSLFRDSLCDNCKCCGLFPLRPDWRTQKMTQDVLFIHDMARQFCMAPAVSQN